MGDTVEDGLLQVAGVHLEPPRYQLLPGGGGGEERDHGGDGDSGDGDDDQ